MTSPTASPAIGRKDALRHLVRVNNDELLRSFRVDHFGLRTLFRLIFHLPSVLFSSQLLSMDRRIARDGLPAAAGWMLARHCRGLWVRGAPGVPGSGPLLITANHPGLSDTLALMRAIGRDDLRVIAADRPLLRALPNLNAALCYVADRDDRRTDVLREAGRHLRSGGALLTFPAGSIEPDPRLHADAVDTLPRWSDSVGVLARVAPGTVVLPALVSGVVSPASRRNPLARVYRTRKQREWVAATLQAMFRRYQRGRVTVSFGEPLGLGQGADRSRIMSAVRDRTRDLIRSVAQPHHVEQPGSKPV